jgi:NTP pyrophosphatase (non-canonical NTP hydrolase)
LIDSNLGDLSFSEAVKRYLTDVNRTMMTGQSDSELELNILKGLYGELGEIMDFDKKVDHNGRADDPAKREDEVGDFMFYFMAYLERRGVDLIAALEGNIKKRAVRFPDGYSHAAARARADKTLVCDYCGKAGKGVGYAGLANGWFHKQCALNARQDFINAGGRAK